MNCGFEWIRYNAMRCNAITVGVAAAVAVVVALSVCFSWVYERGHNLTLVLMNLLVSRPCCVHLVCWQADRQASTHRQRQRDGKSKGDTVK